MLVEILLLITRVLNMNMQYFLSITLIITVFGFSPAQTKAQAPVAFAENCRNYFPIESGGNPSPITSEIGYFDNNGVLKMSHMSVYVADGFSYGNDRLDGSKFMFCN